MTDTRIANLFRRHGRKLVPPLIVALVAAVLVIILMNTSSEATRAEPAREARLVEVTSVTAGDQQLLVEAWGTVQAARQVTLQSQAVGEVKQVGSAFEPGAHVRRGALLLQIDPADYELAVRQRRAELTRARADLALEDGKGAVAEQEFALLAKETGASEEERRLMLREPQRATARAAVASAEAALAAAELALARTTVRAPFNAVVLDRSVNAGTRVTNGAALASLAGTDTFWVELAVPAASLQWLDLPGNGGKGAQVNFFQERVWGKDRFRAGRLIRLRGDLDEKGRMARVLAAVDDPLGQIGARRPALLLGAYVRAEIQGRQLKNVIALDRNWLRDSDVVWVMDSAGKLAMRKPEVVYRGTDQAYVRGGFEAGDRIVTSDLAVAVERMPLRTAADKKERPAP